MRGTWRFNTRAKRATEARLISTDDPFTAALTVGTAVAGAGLSAYGANQRNKAVGRSMDAAGRAATIETQQEAAAAKLERAKRAREAEVASGRIQVLAAERGVGPSGSVAALENQVAQDQAAGDAITNQNLASQSARVRSNFDSTITSLKSQVQNGFLAALQGGFTGATTGLQISGALSSANAAADAAARADELSTMPIYPRGTNFTTGAAPAGAEWGVY